MKLFTRWRFCLSYLNDHKFRNNFQDYINPICNCDHHIETATYFHLHCSYYAIARQTLINKINNLDSNILEHNKSFTANLLLQGDKNLNLCIEKLIFMCRTDYMLCYISLCKNCHAL